jgi:hypothetical protein
MFSSYQVARAGSVLMGNGSRAFVQGKSEVHFGEDRTVEECAAHSLHQ